MQSVTDIYTFPVATRYLNDSHLRRCVQFCSETYKMLFRYKKEELRATSIEIRMRLYTCAFFKIFLRSLLTVSETFIYFFPLLKPVQSISRDIIFIKSKIFKAHLRCSTIFLHILLNLGQELADIANINVP